jgi:RNA polymerase sigma-70 factor (ECF subfamily)
LKLKEPIADGLRRQLMAELVEAHGQALWALVRRLCRHQQDAEDVFQDTAARAWKHLARSRPVVNQRAWLMTIAYHAFLDHKLKTKSHDELDDCRDVRDRSPAAEAAAREEASRVNAAIGELPDGLREVVVLHYTGSFTIKEAAAAMNIPVGTAKSRLATALNELRRALQ